MRVKAATTGKIIDYGIKDSQNMGACMAPAAAFVIASHLKDMNRTPEDYDKIITGDLGFVGQKILFELMREEGYDIEANHMDCGIEIFDHETQDTHAGGAVGHGSLSQSRSNTLQLCNESDGKRCVEKSFICADRGPSF